MKILKTLAGIFSVAVLMGILLLMSLHRTRNIPVRSFERNYLVSFYVQNYGSAVKVSAERIDVFDNRLIIASRGEKDITLASFTDNQVLIKKTSVHQKGLIINWDIKNETLFDADIRQRKVHLTDLRNHHIAAFDIKSAFSRIIRINDSLCLLKARDSARLNDDYCVYNYRSGSVQSYGNLLYNYNDGGFTNDGYFISDGKSKFYHICYYISDIIAFDNMGRPLYKSLSIDKVSTLPKTVEASNGSRYISSETPVIHPAATASKDFVFVASNVKSNADEKNFSAPQSIVDVYSSEQGQYKGSIRLIGAKSIKSLACNESTLYYLSEDRVGTINITNLTKSPLNEMSTKMISIQFKN